MSRSGRTSLIHRLLALPPGRAPAWLCSRGSGTGLDLFGCIAGGLVVAALVLGRFIGIAWGLLAAWPILPLLWLHAEFDRCERRARARRRRGECVACGKLGVVPGHPCANCGRAD